MTKSLVASLLVLLATVCFAEEGPMQEQLRVVQTYTGDADNRIYFRFNTGAMPGCYANSGGRLYVDDPLFGSIYGQVMLLMAAGGIKGKVVFDNIGGPGWSVCRIKGLALYP